MNILLFGATGQLGWELQRSLAPLGTLVAVGRGGRGGRGGLCGDFLDPQGIASTVQAVRPQVIVNAAAYTAVDLAESQQAAATQVNAGTPAVLAREAASCGALLVHYSTDYVFDGQGNRPWTETDATGPLNVYGCSKLAGEQAVLRDCPRHLVLRTSWVYASRGGNFARTMLRLAATRERLSVVADQIGAPTGADLLADVTAHALRSVMQRPELSGLYHVSAAGETSWHGYARFVLERAQRAGLPLQAGPQAVDPIPASAYPTPARRPANSRLDTGRLRAAFGLHLPSWEQGVARMLDEILPHGAETPR